METIAPKTTLIDLEYIGHQKAIAVCLIEGGAGVAIVDPGPTSTLATLRRKLSQLGLRVADLDTILLTYIHLDHAGATGTLVRENPRIRAVDGLVWLGEILAQTRGRLKPPALHSPPKQSLADRWFPLAA